MKFSNVIVLLFVLTVAKAFGQEKLKSFDFKKGEVLDVILLNQTENADELFERYKQTAFPVAFEFTYRPQPGFQISKLTLGTNKAQSFIIGKWAGLDDRKGFLSTIVERVPDFHEQRRSLFPYFGLTYYEVQKDLKFSVDTSKYNVVTALWNNPTKKDLFFFNTWKASVVSAGGKVIVILENGTSPTGYYYNPDVMCIVEWKDEASFMAFSRKHPLETYNSLINVHQFAIQ